MWVHNVRFGCFHRSERERLCLHAPGQIQPFTPPPAAKAALGYAWTTGSIYYSALVVAEAFGSSNVSRIVDLNPNNGNIYTPGYGIYENGSPSRVVLFNYVSDSSGANNYNAVISINGSSLPSGNVTVRYLTASSVAEKDQIYWANQTMGSSFTSDGTLRGSQHSVSISCDTGANTCTIPVYSPSIALVFLTTSSIDAVTPPPGAQTSFSTTVVAYGTATVNPAALSTSNGQMGGSGGVGSTSSNSVGSGAVRKLESMRGLGVGVAVVSGLVGLMVLGMWR